ncbi:hypothetical protein HNQ07_004480 [Deinococcus metalli]|uniref:DUF190 domain-containing protein n=1 Tax=Deinococcus metalli TaxID=1141878 RepID=A0A7W8KIV2_9DEIO|nr:DUF190 domain-containing protein [Deinococcus metalli]MBB5378970.1 hypothetical protein [Deinococcus metalli]GHF63674.1 hypothetical protein GCM10017781_44560 [Deinococcus metalli]
MTWLDAVLLKVYLGATDHIHGESASDWLLQRAKAAGLRGATVTQGSLGFGPDGVLRRAALFHFAQNLPVIVELVDEAAAIDSFLSGVTPELPASTLITTQHVQTLQRTP